MRPSFRRARAPAKIALELVGRRGRRQAAQGEPLRAGRRQPEPLEASAPVPEGDVEQRLGRRRRAGRPPGRRTRRTRPGPRRAPPPTGPSARAASGGRGTGRTRAIPEGEQLAVEDPVPGQVAGRLHDLRELRRDVVEVTREEPDLVPAPVELGADAVVLVLDPDLRPEAGDDLGRVLGRRREHEAQRVEEAQPRGLPADRRGPGLRPRRRPPSASRRAPPAAGGRPKAAAIAASTRPSRSPIRSSPPRILTT